MPLNVRRDGRRVEIAACNLTVNLENVHRDFRRISTTPLCLTVTHDMLFMIQSLLTACTNRGSLRRSGFTALHAVVLRTEGAQLDIARALLDAGADVHTMENDYSTYVSMLAYHQGKYSLTNLFPDRGAELNVPDHCGIARKPEHPAWA
jgi:hypothetical protein